MCAHQEDATWNADMPPFHFIPEGSNIKATCHTSPYSASLYFAPIITNRVCIFGLILMGMSPTGVVSNQLKMITGA